jgi:two-component sensor histidine kinase
MALFLVVALANALLIEALHRRFCALKVAHRSLAQAGQEKDVLLAELAHRVKNDLAILATLVQQQRRRVGDPVARAALAATAERVQVLARVHARLTRRDGGLWVDSRAFVAELCDELGAALVGGRPVTLRVEAESHPIALARAVSVGLIVNELVANALKHAFPGERAGTVLVRFVRVGDEFRLLVTDDGIGCSGTVTSGGLGQRLVQSLSRQLGGAIEAESSARGMAYTLRFPVAAA